MTVLVFLSNALHRSASEAAALTRRSILQGHPASHAHTLPQCVSSDECIVQGASSTCEGHIIDKYRSPVAGVVQNVKKQDFAGRSAHALKDERTAARPVRREMHSPVTPLPRAPVRGHQARSRCDRKLCWCTTAKKNGDRTKNTIF